MDLAYIYCCILYTLIHKKDEGYSNTKSDENRTSNVKTIIYQLLTLFKVTTYMQLLMMYRAWHEMTMCDLICHHRLHSVSRISLNCSPTGDNKKILQFTFCIWTVWIDHSANNKYNAENLKMMQGYPLLIMMKTCCLPIEKFYVDTEVQI